GIRDDLVTGVQTCALPILAFWLGPEERPRVRDALELGDGSGGGIDLPQLAFAGLRDVEPLAIGAEAHCVRLPRVEVVGANLERRRVDGDDTAIREAVEGAAVGR